MQDLSGADHGGNLSAARRAFPSAPEPWLDLSTGVSPYPYPFAALPQEVWTRLPDPAALRGLEAAAARAYRTGEGASVIAAPGTQAIIGLLPHILPAQRVGVLGFSYSEHARVWRASGAETRVVDEIGELADMDIAVVVNPNNPDGRLISVEDLHAIAAELHKHGGRLIVDEAFADFLGPGASIIPGMPLEGVVALRSFGKAYGLPGLRLGFAIAPKDVASKLRCALGCWPASGAAISIGSKALADAAWLAASGERLARDAAALDAILADAGFTPVGGAPLFRLAAHPEALRRFEILGRAGILVRRFEQRPFWLRFGFPSGEAERARLRAGLHLD